MMNSFKRFKKSKGFTLIELLVVISIIGMLSSVVLTSLNSARVKAMYSKTKMEQNDLIKTIIIVRDESDKTLQQITGSGCSLCTVCVGDLRNIPDTHACYTRWINVLTKLEQSSNGLISGIGNMKRDPWGSPYLVDENEGEFPADCPRKDTIRTAGPDGVRSTSDDQSYTIPLSGYCQ
ncbi:MAG: type II secretion system protein [Candidatus Pacebacteria bacterium]|nr:type II secretion system protein [Candidatus Paceibacterota bacterium]